MPKATPSKTAKKAKVSTVHSAKHVGNANQPIVFPVNVVQQGDEQLYVFGAKATELYHAVSINRRIEGKDEGYQRTLSQSRVAAITKHILAGRPLPGSIIVSFDNAEYDEQAGTLTVPSGTDVGWVIDGQHRLAGAEQASRQGTDIDLAVVAFVGLTQMRQIEQFVVINREAKNVPTSLYLDLLKLLPTKRPADVAKERAADLANELKRQEESPFYERIVVTVSPAEGQVSLTNFVRKIAPLVTPEKGTLGIYTEREQYAILFNYFEGLRQVFPQEYEARGSVFFKTVGFGALWNAFPTFFNMAIKYQQGFAATDVIAIWKKIETFDWSGFREYGSGNQAEQMAGDDLKAALGYALADDAASSGAIRL
jgi:DGQHR domain-containing protein